MTLKPQLQTVVVQDTEDEDGPHGLATDKSSPIAGKGGLIAGTGGLQDEVRKRGRPRGSVSRTTQNEEVLFSTDFYFLRAILHKIDHKDAAERYLSQKGPMDRRTAVAYERKLRRTMQRAIKLHRDSEEAQKQLEHLDAPILEVSLGPTLEEFAQRFDEDMYSEAELIELYQDEYGAQPSAAAPSSGVTLKSKLNALAWLRDRLAVKPGAADPVELWIERGIAEQVRRFGVLTLGNLVDWINLTGRRWYESITGVGRNRSKRVLVFLMQNEDSIGKSLAPRIRFPLGERYLLNDAPQSQQHLSAPSGAGASTAVVTVAGHAQVYGIVPMETLDWPVDLLGGDGVFRSLNPNTYSANNDREAVQAWFRTLKEKSALTQDSYQRAIERLVLWAVVERRQALSSLNTDDVVRFRDFLRAPPPHWCSKFPVMRYSADWRPLRGPLGDAAVQQTMSAVATMYADWMECGYLGANAVGSVRSAKRKEMRMDVMRSFADQDLAVIRTTLEKIKDGPSKRRLRAIILLYQTSGLRRGEGGKLTWGMLEPVRLENRISTHWAVTFTGKGNKERKVPIQAAVVEALELHYQDRLALVAAGKLPYSTMEKDDTPLLSVLDDRLTKMEAGTGDEAHDAARTGNATGALADNRIYGILKAFFRQVSQQPGLVNGQADFVKASTHWLRHTFAHQALAGSNRDLPAVQQILGHADIGTTGIYVKADMAARVAAVEAVKPSV